MLGCMELSTALSEYFWHESCHASGRFQDVCIVQYKTFNRNSPVCVIWDKRRGHLLFRGGIYDARKEELHNCCCGRPVAALVLAVPERSGTGERSRAGSQRRAGPDVAQRLNEDQLLAQIA